MRLPSLERGIVPQAKILDYLLSATHPTGRHKAAFFTRFGFSAGSWERLALALLKHAAEHEVSGVLESPFGRPYTVEGELPAPDSRRPMIRSVWFLASEGAEPVFVTAYPWRSRR